MKNIKIIKILICLLFISSSAYAQIIKTDGTSTEASSQLIYIFNENDNSAIQVTNTNDTSGVTIHIQIFRSYTINGGTPDEVIVRCEERDFFDVLTANDTVFYDFDDIETNADMDIDVPIDLDSPPSMGFVVVTPVVSNVDATAISFQHMIGEFQESSDEITGGAMGRDALNFATGEVEPDGTPLDGVTNGFVVLQPEELLFDFNNNDQSTDADIFAVAFSDSYGPAGLLGYTVLPGEVNWTPFIFDFEENPTSCGNKVIQCFDIVGINDTYEVNDDDSAEVGRDELCEGTITPDNANNNTIAEGWVRIFVSGIDPFESVLAFKHIDEDGDWVYTKGQETEINPGENCGVAGDEDGDMSADCADPDCVGMTGPNGETCELTEATCDDGADNDGDGAIDGADTDCDGSESCPTCESGGQCSDGEDNDGDGNSDCADGGCDGATGPNGETCEAGVELTCNDNQDNDGDGTADCDDPDCAIATNCVAGEGGGGGGCSVASTANPSMLNFLLPMIVVGLVVGIRRRYN